MLHEYLADELCNNKSLGALTYSLEIGYIYCINNRR